MALRINGLGESLKDAVFVVVVVSGSLWATSHYHFLPIPIVFFLKKEKSEYNNRNLWFLVSRSVVDDDNLDGVVVDKQSEKNTSQKLSLDWQAE